MSHRGRLLGHEALMVAPLGHPLGLDHRVRREGRRAGVADLARSDEVAERAEGLVEVGGRIWAMPLVQVGPVGVQAPQAVLHGSDDPSSGPPDWFGSGPLRLKNFVARTTSSRRPLSARPT